MRRLSLGLVSLTLAAPLLVTGCGSDRSTGRSEADAASTPTRAPTTSSAPHETLSVADFPLDLGYPHENGDDHSPVVVGPRPATGTFRVCGRAAWDPHHATSAVLGVRYRGESEYYRGRTLVLYPTAAAAGAAVTRLHEAVAACSDDPHGKDEGTTHTLVDGAGVRLGGDQSVVWTDSFYNVYRGEEQHDTGLVVYELVRVGRAVLLAYEYGEGNGTPASRAESIRQSLHHERAVVARMRDLRPGSSVSRA
jgi:hypothetical protein